MHRYKGSGGHNSYKGFENLLKLLKENDMELVGDYIDKKTPTTFSVDNLLIIPDKALRTIQQFKIFKAELFNNNDKYLKIHGYGNNGFIFDIKTVDGGVVSLSYGGYKDFIRGRRTFFKYLNSNDIRILTPYLGFTSMSSFEFQGVCFSVLCNNLSYTLKSYKSFSALVESNGDNMLSINSFNNSFVYNILTYDGFTLEATPSNYKRFIDSRKKFNDLVSLNNFKKLSAYKGFNTEILIDFGCSHGPQLTKPSNFRNGSGCPICQQSKGELAIMRYLDNLNLPYRSQYKLQVADININLKKYDIYIPFYNLIVEIHGIQHYEFVEYFHKTVDVFYEKKEVDALKERYAKKYNYSYMIVDYRESNPELSLKRFKKQFNKFIAQYQEEVI